MGELGMNYLDETEDLAVPGGPGAEAEQQESVLASEIFRDSNSESKGNCSDLLVEANVTPDDESRDSDLPEDTLIDVWNRGCTALQNRPATQALTKQKKFQQHEHASALEAAFTAVLKQPIKLDVLILDTNDKKH
ncbi:hypothetical protein R1flu_014077 [Riccia fluitans]|uniref:Uncharacterized protein n=1 Tax=Riccia fluitans TaxID=41844 RepID=A0ABD1YFF1_9MARC